MNKVNNEGDSAILWAAHNNHFEIVETLLNVSGIIVDQRDNLGEMNVLYIGTLYKLNTKKYKKKVDVGNFIYLKNHF